MRRLRSVGFHEQYAEETDIIQSYRLLWTWTWTWQLSELHTQTIYTSDPVSDRYIRVLLPVGGA